MASDIIVVERKLLESKAFSSLGGTAKTVYFNFRLKCTLVKIKTPSGRKKEWVISNNGQIEYCYSEAEKKGISRQRFGMAIDDLVKKGFIDIPHSGQGGRKGDKSLYAISERWRAWGTEEFVEMKRAKDTREGRGWRRYHQKKKLKLVKATKEKKPRARRKSIVTEDMKWEAAHEGYD